MEAPMTRRIERSTRGSAVVPSQPRSASAGGSPRRSAERDRGVPFDFGDIDIFPRSDAVRATTGFGRVAPLPVQA
jgi:hypothetical protein